MENRRLLASNLFNNNGDDLEGAPPGSMVDYSEGMVENIPSISKKVVGNAEERVTLPKLM